MTISVQDSAVTLLLQPRVGWQKQMTVGTRYTVAMDLALVTPDGEPAPWPLPHEEITYTFELDGGADFDQWVVDDPAVVLHRFGGSYGPARFVVKPLKDGDRSLWLTIINPGGIPVGDHELKVKVLPRKDSDQGGDPAGRESATGNDHLAGGDAGAPTGGYAAIGDQAVRDTREDLRISAEAQREPGPTRVDAPGDTRTDFAHADADADFASLWDTLTGLPQSSADIEPYVRSTQPLDPDEEPAPVRLAEWYNVLGLRRSPSGYLHMSLLPLFPPGTPSGERVSFTVRCAQTDEHGTVFAVIAQPPEGDRKRLQLRSAQSARVPPGIYRVTAELLYPAPGHVRFHGLPTMPRYDPRHWSTIMGSVPRRLGDGAGPAHLIAAIEVCGPPDLVAERIACAQRLVRHVDDEADVPVSYSVLTYGPHSINVHNRDYPEVPVTTLEWAGPADAALDALDRAARRPVPVSRYGAAAQIECVLAELDGRLTGSEGRPVIVTAGGRTAHPPTVDASRIIPCIHRRDWRYSIERLARHGGIAYGAIHDNGFPDELWRFLGNDVGTAIEDFSAPEFALALGLTSGYAQFLPLPLIDGLLAEDALA